MNKLLVSCDEYAFKHNDRFYLREFGHILINRYLDVFDKIQFAVRTKVVNTKSELLEFNIVVNDERIEIFEIPFFQGPKEYAFNYFKISKKIRKVGQNCNIAIFRIPSTVGFACLNSVKKRNIPYAVEVVANPHDMVISSKYCLTRFLHSIIHKQQITACKNAVGASYVTKFSLQKIYPTLKEDSIKSFYSSVEVPESFFLEKRKYPLNTPFVICHSSLSIKTFTKGHMTLINIVKELVNRGYNVEAKFAGEGELISLFMEYAKKIGIEDKIKFLGKLNQDEVRKLYLNSNLMVFPTSSEGLPRVIIEAHATGLPCLSTPVGGIPELLPQEMLYESNNVEGFTNKIIQLIDNPEIYEKMSKIAIDKSYEFSKDILQTRRIEFYNKLNSIVN